MNKAEEGQKPSSDKSGFVTTVAWIFIIITGFTTLISILQNVMITMLPPMKEALNKPGVSEQMPFMARFIFSHMQLFFAIFSIVSMTIFISSIGLLKRKNWARLLFVGLLALGMLWSITAIFLQSAMMPKTSQFPEQRGMPNFQAIFLVMRIFSAVMATGMAILYGWIIKKLVSKKIKQEFGEVSNEQAN